MPKTKPSQKNAGRFLQRVRPALRFAATLSEFADEKHIYLLSAGIAFNTLLCALPVMLVAVSVVGMIWDEQSASAAIRRLMTDFLPRSQSSAGFIDSALTEVKTVFEFSSVAGYVGAGTLLWTASALVSSIRSSLNVVFSLPSPKFFLLYKLKDLGLTLSFSVLLFVIAAITPAVTFATSLGSKILPEEFASWFGGVTANITAAVGTFVFMFILYGYLPNTKMPLRLRLRASVICTVFMEAARFLFGWYLSSVASFGKIYGVYAVLIAIAIWIYYASLIIILSAVISLAAEKHGGFRAIWRGIA